MPASTKVEMCRSLHPVSKSRTLNNVRIVIGFRAMKGEDANETTSVVADGSHHSRESGYLRAVQDENVAESHSLQAEGPTYLHLREEEEHVKHPYPPGTHPHEGALPQIQPEDELTIKQREKEKRKKQSPTPQFLLKAYLSKFSGGLDTRLPIPPLSEIFWSLLGSFLGILCVSAMNNFWSPDINIQFLTGSFGASSVLIYGLPESKLSQPRNFIGGQVLSSIVGVIVRLIIHVPWVASPVAISAAMLGMQVTATVHPPGGATALIVAMMDELPKWSGFSYVVGVASGSVVMFGVALVVNNMAPNRQYPTFWY